MSEKTEMEIYFEEQIAEHRMYLEFAQAGIEKWTKAYDAWKLAAETGEMRRMKPSPRQNVATIIKDAILSFPRGKQFTTRDVFDAMPQEGLDYEKTRMSISAWLQNFVKEGRINKIDRGTYERARPKRVSVQVTTSE